MAATSNSEYTIRYARESDVPMILQLVNELATYEHALHEVEATETTLRQTLSFAVDHPPSGSGSRSDSVSDRFTPGYAKTLLICAASTAVSATEGVKDPDPSSLPVAGMALYFHNYSTWRGAPGIYLEDLFVRPAYRRRGFGQALLQALARECVSAGCKRLEWNVLKWNEPSIRFYESEVVGAKMMDEWVGMRVDGERLERLANAKETTEER